MKRIMIVLAIILAALPLVSAAPTPQLPLAVVRVTQPSARVVMRPRTQACDESSASYLVRHTIEREIVVNGQKLIIPSGFAVGWSCTGPDAAQSAFQEQAATVLNKSAQMIPNP